MVCQGLGGACLWLRDEGAKRTRMDRANQEVVREAYRKGEQLAAESKHRSVRADQDQRRPLTILLAFPGGSSCSVLYFSS